MEKIELLKMVDHTLLSVTATETDIRTVCDDGIKYNCATVCIPGTHIKFAADYVSGKLPICTVVGFPLGYSPTEVKCFEAECAIKNGASEVDMVANICRIKEQRYDDVLADIIAVKRAIGNHTLKVIIETCLLTEQEKIRMCEIVSASGANYIKTSTGFSTAGATREDIALFAKHITGGVKIKAAGGIRSFEDAEEFVKLGATRLGTSALVKLMKSEQLGAY
ncbi:MAG: deoxyribose-phosphate aldolase [Clostridia bacterium]|nr:deoxyribose-phosphate aldolase [Clostridia bacterium]